MRSIRARLAAGLILGLTPLFVLGGWALHATAKRNLLQSEKDALGVKAAAVAAAVGFEDGIIEVQSPTRTSSGFARARHPDYYALLDRHDVVLAASPSAAVSGWKPELARLAENGAVPISLPAGRPGMATIITLHAGTDLEEEAREDPLVRARLESGLRIVVADDVGEIHEEIARLDTGIACVFGATLIGAFVIVFFVLRANLRPLDHIASEAQAIDGAHLDRRFGIGPLPSELAPVRDRLNDLLARLEASFARETRFNTAVAHELRTPIAELRTMAEVALRWPDAQDPTRVVADVLAVTERMQALVSALLLLRRVEAGHERFDTRPVSVPALVSAAVARCHARSSQRRLVVHLNVADGLIVTTQPELLELLVDNWVANAVEYAPAGTVIDVSAARDEHGLRFVVENDAPDLGAADLERLFEPFWRKDEARSDGMHSGLGLPLTKSLARALGFAVRAALARGRLSMELSGPA